MYYEIAEVSRHQGGLIYVLVNLWRTQADFDASEPPVLSNDFLIQLRRQYQRIVTNASGHLKRLDGVFVDPTTITNPDDWAPHNAIGWERDTVTKTNVELRQEVRDHIVAFWRRAKAAAQAGKPYRRDMDQRTQLIRNATDPDSILSRLAVLQGTRQEVVGE